MLLNLIDDLTTQIGKLTTGSRPSWERAPPGRRVHELRAARPGGPCTGCPGPVLGVIARLDEITGIGRDAAQVIIAEMGTKIVQLPTPAHRVLGQDDSPAPSSPVPAAAPAAPAKATPTCAARPASRS